MKKDRNKVEIPDLRKKNEKLQGADKPLRERERGQILWLLRDAVRHERADAKAKSIIRKLQANKGPY